MSAPQTQLVVNADDFGQSPATSRGILRAHREGVVTSTSVLGNCDDVAGVCALLAGAPELGVGVHLTLVGGRPVSPAASLPTLTNPDGGFPAHADEFFLAWVRGRVELPFHLRDVYPTLHPRLEEIFGVRREAAVGVRERREGRGRQHGTPAHEREVHAHAQVGRLGEQRRHAGDVLAVSEHGGARDDALAVRAHDAARDAG